MKMMKRKKSMIVTPKAEGEEQETTKRMRKRIVIPLEESVLHAMMIVLQDEQLLQEATLQEKLMMRE